MSLETSAESPVPVRTIARLISEWVGRLGRVWVEGQVTQVNRRAGSGTVFLTLRDPVAEVSLSVTCSNRVYDAVTPPLVDGARVVVYARPDFYVSRGTLSLSAEEIRPVGVGALLARLEQLKGVLAAEALRRPSEAAAPLLARGHRPDQRTRFGSRAGCPRQRQTALAGGSLPSGDRRRAGTVRGHTGE